MNRFYFWFLRIEAEDATHLDTLSSFFLLEKGKFVFNVSSRESIKVVKVPSSKTFLRKISQGFSRKLRYVQGRKKLFSPFSRLSTFLVELQFSAWVAPELFASTSISISVLSGFELFSSRDERDFPNLHNSWLSWKNLFLSSQARSKVRLHVLAWVVLSTEPSIHSLFAEISLRCSCCLLPRKSGKFESGERG